MGWFSPRGRVLAFLALAGGPLLGCGDSSGPESSLPDSRFVAVAAAMDETCAITSDHRTYCWLVDSTNYSIDPTPRLIATADSLVTIAAGSGVFAQQFCGQSAAGAVYCWGNLLEIDVGYQIGDGVTPTRIGDGFVLGSVAVASGHACALAADSTARCWGSYISGKRGVIGPYPSYPGQMASWVDLTPNAVAGNEKFQRLIAGNEHSCGIRLDGTVACWGDSVASGSPASSFRHDTDTCTLTLACSAAPVMVQNSGGAFVLAGGSRHTCSVTSLGVGCWGSNFSGELGQSGQNLGSTPVLPVLPISAKYLAVGGMHTCALDSAGAAWCWGDNHYGQFGSGHLGQDNEQGRVQFSGSFASLSAGYTHTCGIDIEGRLYCWGNELEPGYHAPWKGTVPVRLRVPD